MHRLLIFFLAATLLPACGPLSCRSQAADFMKQSQAITQEWSDETTLAGQTPRMSLPNEISKLQDIRRRLNAIDAPECASEVKRHQLAAMDETINGYLAFLGQKDEATVNEFFTRSVVEIQAASTAIAEIK